MLNLRGVFAPVVTTFGDRNEAVDLDAFATNLRAYAAAGLNGIVVCGSTGEAALLDEEERVVSVELTMLRVIVMSCVQVTEKESVRIPLTMALAVN